MEIRVLRYFLAVAREQSISAAAEALHLSQPTLSTQLKALEEELGKKLLIRGTSGTRKVTLTEEGMILRKRAEEIIDLVNKTGQEISASQDSLAGEIHIGSGETRLVRVFAKAAKALSGEGADIHYHILSGNYLYVLEQLDKGLVDFGLVYGQVDGSKYNFMEMPCPDEFGVLMRKDSPLAVKERISPEDLWDKPLIISGQTNGGESETVKWLGRECSKLNVVGTYNLILNGSLLVEEGMGYAICFSELINTSGDSQLTFRPLSPPLTAKASVVWKKYQVLSRAAGRFLEEVRKMIGTME